MAIGTLVQQADLLLRNWIKEQEVEGDGRLPSERFLAKKLGVRHYALNRAMAGMIAEGQVERRGYKLYYNSRKTEPPTPDRFSCELVVANGSIHRSSYNKVAKELDIQVNVHSWTSMEEATSILQRLDTPETNCVIFDPPHGQSNFTWEASTTRLIRQGIPVICVGQPSTEVFSVLADYARGLELLIQNHVSLGHREMALATVSPWAPISIEVLNAWKSLCDRYDISSSASRVFLQPNSRILPEDVQDLARKLTKEWNKVTVLVFFTDTEYAIQHLLDELSKKGKNVPRHLSVACLGDSNSLRMATPPVTAATFDFSLMQETAYRLAQRAVRKKNSFGLLPPVYSLRVQPQIALRQSTLPLPSSEKKSALREKEASRELHSIKIHTPEKIPDFESFLKISYPEATKAVGNRFTTVDLSPYVNRPLNFRRGWLGDLPLKHLDPGQHMIHGVPFEVLGGNSRSDCGAVVFHSAINLTGNAQKLPSRISIPIQSKAKAIYILHGCSYAKYLQPFATYSFYNKKKVIGTFPLVSLGQPPPNSDPRHLAEAYTKANIQDWWPDYLHRDLPNARMAPIEQSEAQENVHRHVFLYTYEWINPSPAQEITHLEIKTDSHLSTTLGLLAVSILRPRENS